MIAAGSDRGACAAWCPCAPCCHLLTSPAHPPLQSGAWYRWRAAWATTKRFASLAIVDGATGKPTDACELLLLTKDGHYLLQVRLRCSMYVAHLPPSSLA